MDHYELVVMPSLQQVENSAAMKWKYTGDGIFVRGEGELGFFTTEGFKRE